MPAALNCRAVPLPFVLTLYCVDALPCITDDGAGFACSTVTAVYGWMMLPEMVFLFVTCPRTSSATAAHKKGGSEAPQEGISPHTAPRPEPTEATACALCRGLDCRHGAQLVLLLVTAGEISAKDLAKHRAKRFQALERVGICRELSRVFSNATETYLVLARPLWYILLCRDSCMDQEQSVVTTRWAPHWG